MKQRFALLGASRGLGAHFAKLLQQNQLAESTMLMSRKEKQMAALGLNNCVISGCDFTQVDAIKYAHKKILEFNPHRLIYFAGGGPYGTFAEKDWKDHHWALRVNLIFPMELLHALLKQPASSLTQITFIGSAIAEDTNDPMAASYSVGKHGLLGLIRNLSEENKNIDLRLYSPGYMDTELLPKNAEARRRAESVVRDPGGVAKDLLEWIMNTSSTFHRRFL